MGKGDNDAPMNTSGLTEADQVYLPKKAGWRPFRSCCTQNTVIDMGPKSHLSILGKPSVEGGPSRYGLTLVEESALFEQARLTVKTTYVSALHGVAKARMKHELIEALSMPDTYVVVNILRSAMGQKGGGHLSPLGVYDEHSDSFLLMDVSNTLFTWARVDSDQLFEAMNTVDGDSGMYRGYLIVKKPLPISP